MSIDIMDVTVLRVLNQPVTRLCYLETLWENDQIKLVEY